MTRQDNRRGSMPFRGVIALVPIIACSSALLGCQKTLFSPREGRSQFDRYDMSRDQHAQQFVEDEFGRRTPNLRGRLGQRN
ncbi:MAG: hypothetical protein EA380_06940 [Phycisphaeraceae bacterium]|nr:MAG: hypothetical protein EA380_06940 [Phycisphaeraceae bacterium]